MKKVCKRKGHYFVKETAFTTYRGKPGDTERDPRSNCVGLWCRRCGKGRTVTVNEYER